MSLPMVTAIGNLTADPELRFTPNGHAVVRFRVACNDRKFDKATNEWKDGDTTYIDVVAWRTIAENVAESLQRGDAAVVTGSLKVRKYEKKDGSEGIAVEIEADAVAALIDRHPVKPQRTPKAPSPNADYDPWASSDAPF